MKVSTVAPRQGGNHQCHPRALQIMSIRHLTLYWLCKKRGCEGRLNKSNLINNGWAWELMERQERGKKLPLQLTSMKACFFSHNVFKWCNGIIELCHLDKRYTNILHDFYSVKRMKDQVSIFSCNMLHLWTSWNACPWKFRLELHDHNHKIFVNTINNFLDLKKKRSTINKKC